MRELMIGLALMATAPATSTADIGTILDATDPETVLEIVRSHGEAVLKKDGMGDPLIEGRVVDKDYRLVFYDCSEGRDCKSIMFSAVWDVPDLAETRMADWNREQRFGKAYLDEDGRATVEMNVNLNGGVTRANLDDTIGWWELILTKFPDYHSTLGWIFR